MIVRTKQEAKRAKRSACLRALHRQAADTCCPLVPLRAPLKLVMGNLCFRAESEHIMQGAFIQMGQAVGRKINQKIKSFKGGHFYLPIGGQMS